MVIFFMTKHISHRYLLARTGVIQGTSKEKLYQDLLRIFYLHNIFTWRFSPDIMRNIDTVSLSILVIPFTKIHSFFLAQQNGIIWIKNLGIVKIIVCFVVKSKIY